MEEGGNILCTSIVTHFENKIGLQCILVMLQLK